MFTHITSESSPLYLRLKRIVDVAWSQDNVGPHGETTRAQYTVPSGKLARVVCFFGFIMRGSEPSATGVQRLRVYIQRADNTQFVLTNVYLFNATSGALISDLQPIDLFLREGEKVILTSIDGSTGGNGDYVSNVCVEEYEA